MPDRSAVNRPRDAKPVPRATDRDQADSSARLAPPSTRWLLLIHQIPPKPDYLRVKIGRRLARVGAVPIKNSVYVLPPTNEAYEDFQWIVREIAESGGEAFISEASLVGEGLTDDEVRARFNAARAGTYRAILADARALLKAARQTTAEQKLEPELAKLRRRYETVNAIDFFAAPDGATTAEVLRNIHHTIHRQQPAPTGSGRAIDGATWVTRRDIHVDRIASAWLIRRFVDRRPRFRFVDAKRYAHATGELRFDMFEAEYTHVGDACTFETLMNEFVSDDSALREIAEIVHDVDCKDAKFRRDEAPGLARMITGIAHLCPRDEDRTERGAMLFDDLYAAFGGKP